VNGRSRTRTRCVPRLCGVVSTPVGGVPVFPACSPLMRGCFAGQKRVLQIPPVFPAYAGLFRCSVPPTPPPPSVPRLCGVVSNARGMGGSGGMVFPAYAGLFPLEFAFDREVPECSPLMRGCFLLCGLRRKSWRVFPRLCGVVSLPINLRTHFMRCSPHLRGCFPTTHNAR